MDKLFPLLEQLAKLRAAAPQNVEQLIDSTFDTLTAITESALVGVKRLNEEYAATHAPELGLLGIPGLVDLTFEHAVDLDVNDPIPTPAYVGRDNATLHIRTLAALSDEDDEAEDDDEDWEDEEPQPAAVLTATVTSSGPLTRDQVLAAVQVALDAAGDRLSGYAAEADSSDVGTVTLVAGLGEGITEGSLPPATRVFLGHIPERDVTVTLLIAGEEDPERPALNPQDAVAEQLAHMAGAGVVLGVAEIRLTLERLDGHEFTEAEAAKVLPTALVALESMFGPHTVAGIIDGDTDAHKVARLIPAGDGELDRRALTMGIAEFDGVLPFPGVGRVRAHIAA